MEVKVYGCWQPDGDGFDFPGDQGGAHKDCKSVKNTFHDVWKTHFGEWLH